MIGVNRRLLYETFYSHKATFWIQKVLGLLTRNIMAVRKPLQTEFGCIRDWIAPLSMIGLPSTTSLLLYCSVFAKITKALDSATELGREIQKLWMINLFSLGWRLEFNELWMSPSRPWSYMNESSYKTQFTISRAYSKILISFIIKVQIWLFLHSI